jgi:hypothetical protein
MVLVGLFWSVIGLFYILAASIRGDGHRVPGCGCAAIRHTFSKVPYTHTRARARTHTHTHTHTHIIYKYIYI